MKHFSGGCAVALAVAAACVVAIPSQARANSLDLNSAMVANCIGPNVGGVADCSKLSFGLWVEGENEIDLLRLMSDGSVWAFDPTSPVQIKDKDGNDVSDQWDILKGSDELELKAGGFSIAEPLFIELQMAEWGMRGDEGLTFSGAGESLGGGLVSIEGSVEVPEPAAAFLLGTFMLAGAGIVRRRRDLQGAEAEEDRS